MLDLGYNSWVEDSVVREIRRELDDAWTSDYPQRYMEDILQSAVKNHLIKAYKISISSGFYTPHHGSVEITGLFGDIYLWHN